MSNIFLAHELLEWFNCPLKAYHLHEFGCQHLSHASYFREYIRIVNSFIEDKRSQQTNIHNVEADSIEASHQQSLDIIRDRKYSRISSATLIFKNTAVFFPYIQWNSKLEAWKIIFPVAGHGIKQEYLQLATLAHIVCQEHNIPIAKIMLSYYHSKDDAWSDSDITNRVEKNLIKEKHTLLDVLNFLDSNKAKDENNWPPCHKQYCEQCAPLKNYEIDDVRTLRKSKQLIDELLAQGITKISEIPEELIPNNEVVNRQIQTVHSMSPLIIKDEILAFQETLQYPRYYLDFEAFSTAIPYRHSHDELKKIWGYIPFLFSIQWQNEEGGAVHTQLWSMAPGKNQVTLMWKELKNHLSKAGSIIVYGKQFEQEMIQQLSTIHSENKIGASLISKIVDLQEIFFNLSIYHPEQKGKISLKTITPIWTSTSYESLRINEGIAANYYFTALSDDKIHLFDSIINIPYISQIRKHMANIEDTQVSIKDIATYCKLDTEVMIRIILKIESYIKNF